MRLCLPQKLQKKVNVLDAIMCLKDSWDNVKQISIQKCFINCGFPDQLVHVPVEDDENEGD